MHQLFVLYEDATGYALFRTSEFEEIATFLPQVQRSILDISKFRSVVFLVAFQKFESWKEALENVKHVSSGLLHKTLQLFLEINVPKSQMSKQGVILGIQDPELATQITEEMGIKCSSSGVVAEVIRGIRFHFRKLLKAFNDEMTINKTKLSVSHHYSRAKVNLSLNKQDSMITHGLSILDQLKKDISTLTLRVKKLYDIHFPELFKILKDHHQYIMCAKEIKNRKNMPGNIHELLMSILKEEEKVNEILKSAHNSMGMEICEEDLENINLLIEQVLSLIKQQNTQTEYVKSKMQIIAPSLGNLMGEMAGARLIVQAGSLTHLSKLPSSTVQILGAKKSLFRSMKSKGAALKFSLVSKSSFIGQDVRITKGRMSRFLANKCSLAARSDCFSAVPSDAHGKELKTEVESRFKFFSKGKLLSERKKKKRKSSKQKKVKKLNKTLTPTDMEVER